MIVSRLLIFFLQTLLHVACHAGHVTVLQLLLSRGIDVNATDSDGRTALHNVCLHSQLACALPLTEAGALLLRDNDGCTAMHYALGQPHATLTLHLLHTYPECIKDVWVAISSGTQNPTQVPVQCRAVLAAVASFFLLLGISCTSPMASRTADFSSATSG
jgi:ankyrin repeat protein